MLSQHALLCKSAVARAVKPGAKPVNMLCDRENQALESRPHESSTLATFEVLSFGATPSNLSLACTNTVCAMSAFASFSFDCSCHGPKKCHQSPRSLHHADLLGFAAFAATGAEPSPAPECFRQFVLGKKGRAALSSYRSADWIRSRGRRLLFTSVLVHLMASLSLAPRSSVLFSSHV